MTNPFNRFCSAILMALALFLFPLGQGFKVAAAESCVTACSCCCLAEGTASTTPSCCGAETLAQEKQEEAPAEPSQDGCTDSCSTCLCVPTPALPAIALAPGSRLAQPAWQDFAFAAILPDAAAPRAETPPVPPPRWS